MLWVVGNENWVNPRELCVEEEHSYSYIKKKKKLLNRLREFSYFYEQDGYRSEKK